MRQKNGIDENLFDPRLLERIVESRDGILVRPLSIGDYDRGKNRISLKEDKNLSDYLNKIR